jgi:hypothetical protein
MKTSYHHLLFKTLSTIYIRANVKSLVSVEKVVNILTSWYSLEMFLKTIFNFNKLIQFIFRELVKLLDFNVLDK